MQLWQLIEASNTSHSGMRTLSLLITAEYSAWEWYSCVSYRRRTCIDRKLHHPRPIITFIVILLLPSALTFLTLLIHRIRAARAAQRDRAPEATVHSLPWCVWTGPGCEKHEGLSTATEIPSGNGPAPNSPPGAETTQPGDPSGTPSSSHGTPTRTSHPWFENQVECAICLSEFVKGDRVRILPCHHIFHMDEVDPWLIQRKKLVRPFYSRYHIQFLTYISSALFAKPTSLNISHLYMINRVTSAAALQPLSREIVHQLYLPNEPLC